MKTYFVFLSLFILTAARQIQIKNLKEEKQEKLLHSSPISRPLKRNRRGAWGWFKKAVKSVDKAGKDTVKFVDNTAKDAAKVAEDAAKAAAKAAEDAAKAAEDAAKDANKALEDAAKAVEHAAKATVEAFEDGAEWAGEAIDELIDLVECVSGIDLGCIEEIHEQNTQCIQRNECIFEYGEKCIDIPKQTLTFSEWALPNKLKVKGSLGIDLDVNVAIDPEDVKFSVDVKAIVTNEFDLIMSDGSGYETFKETKLSREKRILKKVFMAGSVPILIEVLIVPMAWVNFYTSASFEAVMKVSGEMSFSQKLTVDVDDGTVTASNGNPSGTPFNVDSLTVTGNFNANAAIRVGPRITIRVNKVPAILDIAAKLGASIDVTVKLDENRAVKTFRQTTNNLSRYRPIDRFTENRELMPNRKLFMEIPQSITQSGLRHQIESNSLSITRSRSTGRNNGGHKWNTRGRRTSSCTDSNQSCTYWANLNYCTEQYVAYMTETCRQSCKICTSPCTNSNQSCAYWANLNYCTEQYVA